MSSQYNRGNGQIIGGVVLIAIGAMFLLDRFWFVDIGRLVSRFWPSILILIGVLQLASGRAKSWVGPLVLIVIGAIFQAPRLGLRMFDWMDGRNLWPLLLIGIGIALLADRMRLLTSPPPEPPRGSSGSGPQHYPQT